MARPPFSASGSLSARDAGSAPASAAPPGDAEAEARAKAEVFAAIPGAAGELAALQRAHDWAATPLGPVSGWSPTLRATVRLILASRFPLLLWWGPQFCQIYNDPYRPVLGTKHPRAIGQPAAQCWPEIWHVIAPLIERPYQGGAATWMDDIELDLRRHGFAEETHFIIAYSPVPDERAAGGIGGVLATVHETTEQVMAERRARALGDLGARATEAQTPEQACAIAAEALGRHVRSLPFALLYLLDGEQRVARLAAASGGLAAGDEAAPEVVDLGLGDRAGPWPLLAAKRAGRLQVVEGAALPRLPKTRAGSLAAAGREAAAARLAAVVPLSGAKPGRWAGFLVAGCNPGRPFDEPYANFLTLAGVQIGAAIAYAEGYEQERRRAEALAELDRAKTAFFSNISHELRTPLTLMLGPTEDALARPQGALAGEELAVVHRGQLRLLRMVNALLDFSRLEAGRARARFQATDLAAYTADLAAVFRSAIERAGLRLEVDCPPLAGPAYVDREMWEKIVLNLLSNALKFTFSGGITVRLRAVEKARTEGEGAGTAGEKAGPWLELSVRDTGVGIAAAQLPLLFQRFSRIPNTRARTHEGTGIGLALVAELAGLHGGAARVTSEPGVGSEFSVTIPVGRAELAARDGASGASSGAGGAAGAGQALGSSAAEGFVQETFGWLGGEAGAGAAGGGAFLAPDGEVAMPSAGDAAAIAAATATGAGSGGRVLVAEDNADMREYLRRLLSRAHAVETAPNGAAALAAARARPPDLVLSDIMMPELDGVGLLRALRAEAGTREIPVILLSARAGEEAVAAGLETGADDYLIKPFTARELLARVGAHLQLRRARREALEGERALRARAEAAERELRAALQRERRQAEALIVSEKLAATGRLAAALAHEVKNPLEAVTNYLYLAREEAGKPERVRAMLAEAERQLDRIATLANHTLGLHRGGPAAGWLDVAEVLDQLLAIFTPRLRTRGVQIERAWETGPASLAGAGRGGRDDGSGGGPFTIWAVRGEVQQIFSNLIANAMDAMERGGRLRLAISAVGAFMTSMAGTGGDRGAGVEVVVADSGPGFSAEGAARAFEPFYTTKGESGTGLGLWIVREILARRGGSVRLETASEGGAAFRVFLPRGEPPNE